MIHQKIALVTGGGRGIGRAIALALARDGSDIVIADIALENAESVGREVKDLGRRSLAIRADVSNIEQVKEIYQQAFDIFGGINILVNNAGISSLTPLEEITEEDWTRMLDVNLKSVFFCSQIALPHMRKNKWGRIINLASIAGEVGGIAVGAHYSASKAGVICLTKAFAKRVTCDGITVNAVAPGVVMTDMINTWPQKILDNYAAQIPAGRFASPEDIAEAIAFLASERASYISGVILDVNGGMIVR